MEDFAFAEGHVPAGRLFVIEMSPVKKGKTKMNDFLPVGAAGLIANLT